MKKILTIVLLTLGFSGLRQTATAQVPVNAVPSTYTQDFDSFDTNDVVWTDNSVLQGWFIAKPNGPVTNLVASDGSIISTEVYNYGSDGDSDRALGSIAGFNEDTFYGVQFTNSSILTITNVNISFAGEQWRASVNSGAQTIEFFYRVGGTDFPTNNVGWTPVTTLNFTSPQTNQNVFKDGNDPANRVLVATNIAVTVAPGQTLWLRWSDLDNPVETDHGLGIDDLSVQFQGNGGLVAPLNATVELKKPKLDKSLNFKGSKGFPFKALVKTTNLVTSVSYFAFGGTNDPTNVVFTTAGKLKEFKKGKKLKQGFRYLAKNKGSGNKPGIGITAGATPVTLKVRVVGSNGGTNSNAQLITNFVFNTVKVK